MSDPGLIEHWYSALSEPFGIVLQSNRPESLAQKLYAARREAFDEALSALSIVTSPTNPGELWIIKRRPKDGPPL